MSYHGYVTNLTNIRPHPNADRLVLATCFRNTVCIAKDMYQEGELVVYFPVDGELSVEFCNQHDLIEKYDENGKKINAGYLSKKRNVKAIKLRGEQSDGLVMKLDCLAFTGADLSQFQPGDMIDTVNGIEICRKYIPPVKVTDPVNVNGKKSKKQIRKNIAPLFFEHKDTEQLQYNLEAFHPGDQIEITRKLHGTSQRTAYTKVFKGYHDSRGCKIGNAFRHILSKLTKKDYEDKHDGEPIYDWDYVCGTRRTVIDGEHGGFYGSHEFRLNHHQKFIGKLWKGETVYYEVVGFTHTGEPIMSPANNKKTNDKEFIKRYGETTIFSYGCSPTGKTYGIRPDYFAGDIGLGLVAEHDVPQSDIYVYRMTMTNEDGEVVEYTPDFMRYRCEQMGIKTVPVEWSGVIPADLPQTGYHIDENGYKVFQLEGTAGDWIAKKAEEFYDGPEPIDPSHVREGVVIRILNKPSFVAYKHKNFSFKVIENIAKADATTADMEEAEEVTNE